MAAGFSACPPPARRLPVAAEAEFALAVKLPADVAAEFALAPVAVEAMRPPRMFPGKPVLDEVRGLLRAAAEIEHALLVQYLYAAYSATTEGRNVAVIAIEEMGHLVTVQNLLRAVGGDPHLDRDDMTTGLDDPEPFPFVLEPMSLSSLAKYVLAEMPRENSLSTTDQEFVAKLREKFGPQHGADIRRVGLIYSSLYWFFLESDQNADPELIPDTSEFPAGRHLGASDFAPDGVTF